MSERVCVCLFVCIWGGGGVVALTWGEQVAKIGNPAIEDQKHVSEKAKTFLAGFNKAQPQSWKTGLDLSPSQSLFLPLPASSPFSLLSPSHPPSFALHRSLSLSPSRSFPS